MRSLSPHHDLFMHARSLVHPQPYHSSAHRPHPQSRSEKNLAETTPGFGPFTNPPHHIFSHGRYGASFDPYRMQDSPWDEHPLGGPMTAPTDPWPPVEDEGEGEGLDMHDVGHGMLRT